MKKKISFIAFGLCFFLLSLTNTEAEIHFQIKKEFPATGLTLGWMLPEDKLQSIVGDDFKPVLKDGKGFLMIFIASAKKILSELECV